MLSLLGGTIPGPMRADLEWPDMFVKLSITAIVRTGNSRKLLLARAEVICTVRAAARVNRGTSDSNSVRSYFELHAGVQKIFGCPCATVGRRSKIEELRGS
jgi:hypothetical protein